jgi:phage-related tail protein
MGAIQAGMVLAQKPPAYAEGTDNHSGGLMLVNDGVGSNYQEKVILPSGKVIRPQGRNVLMDAPKGTKVLNHEQQLFEMLQSNNISMSSQGSSGLTYDEMNEIFQNNFANIKTQNTIFDKNGFQTYVRNGNSITRSNSNRSQAIGISV